MGKSYGKKKQSWAERRVEWPRPEWVKFNAIHEGVSGFYHQSFVGPLLKMKGLSDGTAATSLAIAGGYARVIDGVERWHYLNMRVMLDNAWRADRKAVSDAKQKQHQMMQQRRYAK